MSNLRNLRILTNDNNAAVEQNTEIHINTSAQPEVIYPQPFPSVYPVNDDNKDKQIKILELILDAYENNPLIIDKLVVVEFKKLNNLIKLLTEADKVEIHINEDSCCTCFKNELCIIQKIFIIKDNKTLDFKYSFNEAYSLLKRHNISLKMTY